MTKPMLLMIASIFFSPSTWSADKASNATDDQRAPAIAFEKMVSTSHNSMSSDQPVLNVNNGQAWVKRRHAVSNVTYDVKKTDSLLNPIIGFVSFSIRIDESALTNNKEDALQITRFNESRFQYDASLNYSYIDGIWKFKNSRVKSFFDGRFTHESKPTEEKIISRKFVVPLHYWMPPR